MNGINSNLPRAAVPHPAHDAAASVLGDVFRDVADIGDHLDSLWSVAWANADERLLELCRLRIAQLLRNAAEMNPNLANLDEDTLQALTRWPVSPHFDERDRAGLAFCEMWMIDVASIDDSLANELIRHLGAQGLVDFANALLIIEQRQRLALIWKRLADMEEGRHGA